VLRATRIVAGRTLAKAAAKSRPGVLLSMSGIRFYGIDRGDEELTEVSAPGEDDGLLTLISKEWEEATAPASEAGVRVVHLRTGLVFSGRGGLLPPLVRGCRFGLGRGFWTGREYWSHVSLHDAVRAIRFLGEGSGLDGPVNIGTPNPMRNADLMRLLRRLLDTPFSLPVPVPRALLYAGLGQIANEVFGGLRVIPDRLTEAGFTFTHPDAESTLRAALNENRTPRSSADPARG
jgi:uncharacterized protein (TIGR01777 family)